MRSRVSNIARSAAVFLSVVFVSSDAYPQSGLRESLERLDTDQDGEIDPDEITPLARPYLERIARVRRISLNRSNDIEDFQEAARLYYALQNGLDDDRVRARPDYEIQSFRPDDEDILIPEFGLADIKYPYTQDDLDDAERTLRRSDRNDDGYLDRSEARRARWTNRDPFESDLDKDNRLSKMELTQRYARRRLLDGMSDELVQKARRVGNGIERSGEREDRRGRSSWWRRGGSSYWLTASLLGRFDENRNGRLEAAETQAMGVPMGAIDVDRDGELTREELQAYTMTLQEEAGDTGEGLPGWFFELDADRDGQVSMPEFTTEWTEEKMAEFTAMDRNADGLLTENEVLSAKAMVGGQFANTTAEVLPPKKTVISEIEVNEDLIIGDLNLEISVTHSSVGMLDGYLTGPEGQRVELFTDVGRGGDNFEETVFDDEADKPIVKAKPPFSGSFSPEAVSKRQPGLSQFNGQNARGVWQLVIRASRSDRFGMLHRWALQIRAEDAATSDRILQSQTAASGSVGATREPVVKPSDSSDSSNEQEADAAFANASKSAASLKPATEDWINAAGPEEAEKRRERLERYQAWAQQRKEQGEEISADDKQRFFGDLEVKSRKDPKR